MSIRLRSSGQGIVEYALILALVSLVAIIVLVTVGQTLNQVFSNIIHSL